MHHFIAVPLGYNVCYLTIDFRVFYAFAIYTGTNATFEFLLRYMSIIKKATLSDITLLFDSRAINLSVKHGILAEKEKGFQFFIDFIFTNLKGEQSTYTIGRFVNIAHY